MFKLEPTAQEMKEAGIVADSSQLITVRISAVAAENHIDMEAESGGLFSDVGFGLIRFDVKDKGMLAIEAGVRVLIGTRALKEGEVNGVGADCPDGCALIDLRMIGEYKIPEGPVPENVKDAGLPSFAKYNGLHNCWPYFRQELQHITTGMGLPPFVLGPLLIRVLNAEATPK